LTDAAAEVSAKAIVDGRKVRDSRVHNHPPHRLFTPRSSLSKKADFHHKSLFCEEFRLRPYLEMDAAFARFR
jgi:hypothetical protein